MKTENETLNEMKDRLASDHKCQHFMSLQNTTRETDPLRHATSSDYLYGCPNCDWWDESRQPDFGNCPLCDQPKVVWNQTDAEHETDYGQMLEDQLNEILYC